MLYQLSIRNVAIIESVELSLEPGLNILTGETGAGKSILIDSHRDDLRPAIADTLK